MTHTPKKHGETMEERFEEKARKWVKGQDGYCMCLGDCERCGYHGCHGCLCVFLPFIRSEIALAVKEREEEMRIEVGKLKAIRIVPDNESTLHFYIRGDDVLALLAKND